MEIYSNISNPRTIITGKDLSQKVKDLVGQYWHEKKVKIITGEHTSKYAYQLQETLGKNIEVYVLPPGLSAREILEEHSRHILNAQVLAVGGGRILDAGKLIAAHNSVEWASIPTTTSNDSMITGIINSKMRYELESIRRQDLIKEITVPLFCVADLETIAQAPDEINRSGVGDVLSNYTAVYDWMLAAKNKQDTHFPYNNLAAGTSLMAAWHLIQAYSFGRKIPEKEERLKVILEAINLSGDAMNRAGSSRPCSGGDHDFDAIISRKFPENKSYHGQRVGLGALVDLYFHNRDNFSTGDLFWAFCRELKSSAQFKRSLDNKLRWQPFKKMLKACGLPMTAKELGLSREDILEVARDLPFARPERPTIFTYLYKTNPDNYMNRIERGLADMGII